MIFMNTYIIKAYQFPATINSEKLIKVQSNKNLNDVLTIIKNKLESKNVGYEYDLYGWTQEDFLNNIEEINID